MPGALPQSHSTARSIIYTEASVDFRAASTDALIERRETLQSELDTIDDFFSDDGESADLARTIASDRLEAIDLEIRRRSFAQSTTGRTTHLSEWGELAKYVKERIEVPDLFRDAGWQLRRAGRNSRRNADEYAGACPACAGTDRLRVWAGPNGAAWCRQCGWHADAIAVMQSLHALGFRDAVTMLAKSLGTAVAS